MDSDSVTELAYSLHRAYWNCNVEILFLFDLRNGSIDQYPINSINKDWLIS